MTMQDRLRFRAWYMPLCEDNKPCYVYDVEQLYDGRTNKGFSDELGWASSFGTLLDSPEQFIVEQCTGLKDKNDKLIYEGDIVKCSYKTEYYIGLIKWDKDYIQFSVEVDGELFSFSQHSKEDLIEVIGNIHQNADLLEDKDENHNL